MWLSDLVKILKTLPNKYWDSYTYKAIKAGYKTIVLETETFSLVCYLDTGKWEKHYNNDWRNKNGKEILD